MDLTIRVVGAGCPRCRTVEARVFNVLARLDVEADVRKITQASQFADLGVFSPPGVIINGTVVSQGKIPSEDDLEKWISDVISQDGPSQR